jgi:hypothetical protein
VGRFAESAEEAFVGFRTWRLDAGLLHGANNQAWNVGDRPTKAECIARVHGRKSRLPVATCTCGLHAFYEIPEGGLYVPNGVFGAVIAWGKHMKASNGFRVEWALPVALARHGKMQLDEYDNARAYCEEWELPFCNSLEELEEEALRYAPKVPDELRTSCGDENEGPQFERHLPEIGAIGANSKAAIKIAQQARRDRVRTAARAESRKRMRARRVIGQ